MVEVNVGFRIWIEINGLHLLGPGGYDILKAIEETGSLSSAARKLGMSYRFVWNYVNRMEKASGLKLVEASRGSKGGARLTREALQLIKYYEDMIKEVSEITSKWSMTIKDLIEASHNQAFKSKTT